MKVYWLEQSEGDVPADNDWLGASEAARLNGMRFAGRRADWRLGRWTAKRAVAAYLNLPGDRQAFSTIEIRPAPCGAPEVYCADEPAAVTVSLSHRAGRAICSTAPPGAALGCDLEWMEPRSDAFVADYFTAEEQALIGRASGAERSRLLALLWSGKESALKALRTGLREDTRSVVVIADEARCRAREDTWLPLLVLYTRGQIFRGWWQHTGRLVRTLVALPPPLAPAPLLVLEERVEPSCPVKGAGF